MKAGAMLRALVTDGLVMSDLRFTLDDKKPLLHYELTQRGRRELEDARERASKYGRPGPRRRRAS
jgi:DNA-binding PadR family transcriptional regulator